MHYFWLGASADADRATQATPGAASASPPCGECPLRETLIDIHAAILAIPIDEALAATDRAYDLVARAFEPPES